MKLFLVFVFVQIIGIVFVKNATAKKRPKIKQKKFDFKGEE